MGKTAFGMKPNVWSSCHCRARRLSSVGTAGMYAFSYGEQARRKRRTRVLRADDGRQQVMAPPDSAGARHRTKGQSTDGSAP
jgi:hypothetical protein